MAYHAVAKDLNTALRWAKEAVRIDKRGEDYGAAMDAYAKCVSLLGNVVEVLECERSAGRLSKARDNELYKLARMHDVYRDRMLVLSITFGFEMPPELEQLMTNPSCH
ncbi:hypothetical protein NLJ89_g4331 [Agrocybe chaxingu]|uniref:Uncharacterized protein n=1 Tax=Agrocybe chaxingu TaxID=84603 RepID=A0A9W8K0Q9_9AGAR|nr:hypothetical protein NLJ89_g4331 [Agrocybe chaxingu]